MSVSQTPRNNDVSLAKTACRTFGRGDLVRCWPSDNNPDRFRGSSEELGEIRRLMKRYEEEEASIFEDKTYYDARFRLQFVEVED